MSDIVVILLNMGAPRDQADVGSYLKALFADPQLIRLPLRRILAPIIVKLRTPVVQRRYAAVHGSPLPHIMAEQASALAAKLNESGEPPSYEVHVGMRYSAPLIRDSLELAARSGCRKVIGVSMYPHFCSATTGSSLRELERQRAEIISDLPLTVIDRYPDQPHYIEAMAQTVRQAQQVLPAGAHVLFSAHGIPQRIADQGDPYVGEIETTADAVAQVLRLPNQQWSLSYQSRLGPVKWVGPYTDQRIEQLAREGVRALVIVPISFTADNLETVYDIDLVLAQKAKGAGIDQVVRAPTLNQHPLFIEALARMIRAK